jgi:glutaredoxin-like protein
MPNPVKLVVFTEESGCEFCREARALVEEFAGLSDRLSFESFDLTRDAGKAAEYRVDKVPAVCVAGERDYGIRFYGVPAGFEFSTLLSLVELVGRRDSGLAPESRQKLAGLTAQADLQMFVTLSCPACPLAAAMAARLALESEHISLSIIDSAEFQQLAGLYGVLAVPKTVVNRGHSFEGALPEDRFVDEVLKGAAGVVLPA